MGERPLAYRNFFSFLVYRWPLITDIGKLSPIMNSDKQYSKKCRNINYVYQFYTLNLKLLHSIYAASSFQGNATVNLVPGTGWDWE